MGKQSRKSREKSIAVSLNRVREQRRKIKLEYENMDEVSKLELQVEDLKSRIIRNNNDIKTLGENGAIRSKIKYMEESLKNTIEKLNKLKEVKNGRTEESTVQQK